MSALYHYCVLVDSGGTQSHIAGCAVTPRPISTKEEYREFVEATVAHLKVDRENAAIVSLTRLDA